MAEEKKVPNLKKLYQDEVAPALMQKFGYKSTMQIPRLEKIVVNVGCSEARENAKVLDAVVNDLTTITGQKAVITKAKKSVANFKLREGMPIGAKVTLRGNKMWEFLDRLFNVALPRVRDFRGISADAFDGRGNYALGVKEQLIFPEIEYDKIDKIRGMDIVVCTTAQTDEEARELLKLVGLDDTGKKKVKNFSLGMRQRLGIAVALAGSPDFLVLDEPVNGLDPQGIVEVRELILRLNRERGITVLVSSHILDELSRLATHYGFMDGGYIIKEICAEELESACRKCTQAEVSDTAALARVLDKMGLEYSVLSEREADIFGKVPVTRLAAAYAKEGGEIFTLKEKDESLESYFIGLLGGARRD